MKYSLGLVRESSMIVNYVSAKSVAAYCP